MRRDLIRLAKSTAIYGLGGAVTKLLALLLLPLFTSYLTPAEYGVVTTLTLLSTALIAVFSLGLGVSLGICYFEVDSKRDREAAIWTAFAIQVISVVFLGIAAFASYERIGAFLSDSHEYDMALVLAIAGSCAAMLAQPFALSVQYRERATEFALISLISAIAGAAASVYLVVVWRLGAAGLVMGTALTQVVSFGLFFVRASLPGTFSPDRAVARKLLVKGLPMIPSFLSLYILLQGNQLVLKESWGFHALGVYSVGFALGMAMNLLVSAFTNAWPPFFLSYWNDRQSGARIFGRVFTYYVIAFGSVSLLFFIWAKPIVMLVASPDYYESHRVVGWSATAQWLSGVFSVLLPPIYYAKRVEIVTLIQGSAALLAIAFALVLIPRLGIDGAAFTLALGFLCLCVLQYGWNNLCQHELRIEYDWTRVGNFAVLYVSIAVVASLFATTSLIAEIARSVFTSGLLVAGLFWLVKRQEWRAIVDYVRRLSSSPMSRGG